MTRAIDRRVRAVERVRPPAVTAADILASPAWWELRGALVRALRPYPEATAAAVAAMREPGDGDAEVRDARRRQP